MIVSTSTASLMTAQASTPTVMSVASLQPVQPLRILTAQALQPPPPLQTPFPSPQTTLPPLQTTFPPSRMLPTPVVASTPPSLSAAPTTATLSVAPKPPQVPIEAPKVTVVPGLFSSPKSTAPISEPMEQALPFVPPPSGSGGVIGPIKAPKWHEFVATPGLSTGMKVGLAVGGALGVGAVGYLLLGGRKARRRKARR